MTYGQHMEEEKLFQHKPQTDDKAKHVFNALASHGNNNARLAQLLSAFDFAMSLLKWDVKLTDIVTNYQASVDAKYHNDYVDIAKIEELDKRVSLRRSMRGQNAETQQQSGGLI